LFSPRSPLACGSKIIKEKTKWTREGKKEKEFFFGVDYNVYHLGKVRAVPKRV
jgi:hypothetical protein